VQVRCGARIFEKRLPNNDENIVRSRYSPLHYYIIHPILVKTCADLLC
jgi:hypothetical protein